MLNFIVLGILPGTSLIVTLTWVLITALVLIVATIVWYELKHSKKTTARAKSSSIRFNKVSTS